MRIKPEEALRYAGVKRPDGAALEMAREMAALLEARLTPRSLYQVFRVEAASGGMALPDAGLLLPGELARAMLAGCARAALVACTLTAEFDALLRTWEKRDMARAVVLDACGSAYVEAGCDAVEAEIARRFPEHFLTDRFSPGYGDLPLNVQGGLLRALGADKFLGIQAGESHLLLPVKSVTAVIGLADAPQPARIRGCAYCARAAKCRHRKGGGSCVC